MSWSFHISLWLKKIIEEGSIFRNRSINGVNLIVNLTQIKMKKSFIFLLTFLLSFALHAQTNCSLTSFSYEVVKEADAGFFVKIKSPVNIIEDYTVFINDEPYPEPVEIAGDGFFYGPVPFDCSINNTLYVVHNEIDACSILANMGYICPDYQDCKIENIKHKVHECDDNVIVVELDFDHKNTLTDYFDLISFNGDIIGYYRYSDLPIRFELERTGSHYAGVIIQDNDNPNCVIHIVFPS